MHDANGTKLCVGDEVCIPCTITNLCEGEQGYWNVSVETRLGRRPGGQKETLSEISPAQLVLFKRVAVALLLCLFSCAGMASAQDIPALTKQFEDAAAQQAQDKASLKADLAALKADLAALRADVAALTAGPKAAAATRPAVGPCQTGCRCGCADGYLCDCAARNAARGTAAAVATVPSAVTYYQSAPAAYYGDSAPSASACGPNGCGASGAAASGRRGLFGRWR